MGFYASGHPLDEFAGKMEKIATVTSLDVARVLEDDEDGGGNGEAENKVRDGARATACGLITGLRTQTTRNGQLMAFAGLEDLSGVIDLLIFPNTYAKCRRAIFEDAAVVARGTLSFREDETPKLLCDELLPLADVRPPPEAKPAREAKELKGTKKIFIKIPPGAEDLLSRAKPVFRRHAGETPVCAYFERTKKTALAERALWVSASAACLEELRAHFGAGNVVLK
jgi:DNA polymerase-3 subunit alpha